MNTVLQGPTMTNPDRLDTVSELRHALDQANNVLMQQFAQICVLDDAGRRWFAVAYLMLKAHVANDPRALNETLEQLLSDMPRLHEQIEDEIESTTRRSAH